MDLEKLKLLLDVVDTGAMSKAAVVRGVPQSFISRQVTALEREYGGRLFNRTGRGVSLSELGLQVIPKIRELIHNANELESMLREESRVPRGEVKVGILSTFLGVVAVQLFDAVRATMPEVSLKLFEGTSGYLEELLATGRIDLGLVLRNQGSQPSDFFLPDAIVFHVAGHRDAPAVARPTITFRELCNLPLVLPVAQGGLVPLLEKTAREVGVRLNVVMETDSFPIQLHLAASGAAFAVVGPSATQPAIAPGKLKLSRLVEPEMSRSIGLSFTTARPTSLACRETARLLRRVVEAASRIPP